MRALIVSGIWPPDVGGPASHAPEVAGSLRERGHEVEVVVTADRPPAPQPYPVSWIDRATPIGLRHVRTGLEIARRAHAADVVYTTGMFGRSSLGSLVARRPYVVKLTADPAYERARRRKLFAGSIEEFQRKPGGAKLRALRAARDAELRLAAHVVCPSGYLRELTIGWGVGPGRVTVLPNPTPSVPALPPREEIRRELGVDSGPLLAFAGRLTAQKSLGVALAAVERQPEVTFLLAGDGPDRAAVEREVAARGLRGRVRLLGPLPRERVLELFRAADASLLSSSWENFPHTVVEALAVGTPVIATAAGGVGEVVRDGENGLLVPVGDADGLTAAIGRFFADPGLRDVLRAGAAPSVAGHAPEAIFARLEEILLEAARRG